MIISHLLCPKVQMCMVKFMEDRPKIIGFIQGGGHQHYLTIQFI